MAFTLVRLTHAFRNPDGSAASGVIAFRLSQRITNGGVSYAEQVPVHATLNATGQLTQQLPANNDPATVPGTSNYIVTFFLNSAQVTGDEVAIVIPYNAGSSVTLGSLLPAHEGKPL